MLLVGFIAVAVEIAALITIGVLAVAPAVLIAIETRAATATGAIACGESCATRGSDRHGTDGSFNTTDLLEAAGVVAAL